MFKAAVRRGVKRFMLGRPAFLKELMAESIGHSIPIEDYLLLYLLADSRDSRAVDIRQVCVRLPENSSIGAKGEEIATPIDRILMPQVLRQGHWQSETVAFLLRQIERSGPCILLDIGANIGLFTRQVLRQTDLVRHTICVEPDPTNVACLKTNIAQFENVDICECGLGPKTEPMTLYRDMANKSNCSFCVGAVAGRQHDLTTVTVKGVVEFFSDWKARLGLLPLIWKSDTQGFDELIVSLVPDDIWRRVHCATIELWRIGKPDYDKDAFVRKIDAFPFKQMGGKPVASAEVMDYLRGRDQGYEDLLLWR